MDQTQEDAKTKKTEMSPRIPCEAEYDFVLALTGISELSQEAEDALFEAGCDDSTISIQSGRVFLTFSRVAHSMGDAVLTAIRDVRRANIGASVLRVDDCNLVTQSEIGRKINRTRQQVFQYVSGERGPGGFPPPACQITDKAPLWKWCEVAYWLWHNGIIKENALRAAQEVDAINSVLEFCHQKKENPDLVLALLSDLEAPAPSAT